MVKKDTNLSPSTKKDVIKKVKSTLAKEGVKLKGIELAKGSSAKKPLKVINPLTSRKVAKDGPTFKKLVEEGYKFVPVKKSNREFIAGIMVPPKAVVTKVAKENNMKPETLQSIVKSRISNFASSIFGSPAPPQEPNVRQMQNQRNALAEKPRLNQAERKEMQQLNRNINQVTQLNRAENQLVNMRPRNNQVREAINEVRETRNEVPVNENKLKTVLGNAEEVVIKANENTLTERKNAETVNAQNVAPPEPVQKTNINAQPNLVNVGNNGIKVGKNNNNSTGTRNVFAGAAPVASPIGPVRPIGEKYVNAEKNAKKFDKTLGETLAKIIM